MLEVYNAYIYILYIGEVIRHHHSRSGHGQWKKSVHVHCVTGVGGIWDGELGS